MDTKTATLNPTEPSAHVGRWIESYGVAYTTLQWSIDSIDVERSLRNQARRDPMCPETARIYRDAILAGSIFPPLVGHMDPHSGQIILIDGNTRLSGAIQANATHVYVYLVDTNDTTILDMTASANAILNGREAAADDRVRHAMRMVESGMSVKDAARQLSIGKTSLRRHINASRVLAIAEGLGMNHIAKRMELGYLEKLNDIGGDLTRELLPRLAAAAESSPNITEFGKMVKAISSLPPDDRPDAVVSYTERQTKAINVTKRAPRKSEPWAAFTMHAAAIAHMNVDAIAGSMPPHRRAEVKRLADDVRYLASNVERAL